MAKKPAKKPAKRKAVKRPKTIKALGGQRFLTVDEAIRQNVDIEAILKSQAKPITGITSEPLAVKNAGIVEPPPEPTSYTATYKLGREEPFIDETHEHATARAGLILAVAAFIIAMGLLWSFFS